jgi:hypothetical protein
MPQQIAVANAATPTATAGDGRRLVATRSRAAIAAIPMLSARPGSRMIVVIPSGVITTSAVATSIASGRWASDPIRSAMKTTATTPASEINHPTTSTDTGVGAHTSRSSSPGRPRRTKPSE